MIMVEYTKTGNHRYMIIDFKKDRMATRYLGYKTIITHLLDFGYLFSGSKKDIIATKTRYRKILNRNNFLAMGKYGYVVENPNLDIIDTINTVVLDRYDTDYNLMSLCVRQKIAPFIRKDKIDKLLKEI